MSCLHCGALTATRFKLKESPRRLEKANQSAPDDDRVWLALADLATRTGRFEEADRWLKRCEQARPDDHAVWKARLEWAKNADRPDELARAASHLPASSFTRARTLELQSWLAARGVTEKPSEPPLTSFWPSSRPNSTPSNDWPTSLHKRAIRNDLPS